MRSVVFAIAAAISFGLLSTPWALMLGIAFAWTMKTPHLERVQGAAKRLLPLCVVGLGAGMHLGVVVTTGLGTVVPTAISIGVCFAVGAVLAKRFGIGPDLALLLTAGTAICGGSAIAAASEAMRAKVATVTVALSTIFVLNGIALFVFPPLGRWLSMSPETFGAFAALAIHDTSSVVGAAANYDVGGVALEVATATKLARALWIVPVTFVLSAVTSKARGGSAPVAKPWFILGFVVVAALCTFVPGADAVGTWVAAISRRGLALVLFLVGRNCRVTSFATPGPKRSGLP